ncbi:MAG: phosphopantothenate/pantothenate synthetase [Euryarchaeota archaeon]|jgi:4-phosphopantoate--beta-alanine ligase|nr:phosphopantothenate/pantothenate synthetase [Euryarchaeota archaeon]MBT5594823.1 phosphopantothenate/pantothenate synthetase [Euryarchaeota archaeon]MBT5843814.1 phosphopantothenate/pantothenate synthetase [Euryarchaeota archaeon]MBT6640141.1 phosphopantothenate/pantothenate synthetase [Euryarchaeota archaeon]MBT6845361.1 phosphopantothenate/pantothenate synthetase [Euryarchaeota archaeon]
MSKIAADPSHPRYQSLLMRHRLEEARKKGMLAGSALIAHGRGEAFDYLLGEQTISSALIATRQALAHLSSAKHPVISLNGNVVALAGEEVLQLAYHLKCPVEINIFYRTPERMEALFNHLNEIKQQMGLDVEILGAESNARIPGLEGPRANCCKQGIFESDVILVPLEDGDRCEALVAMGKTVLVIDLNPFSRTARMASVTIVDELTRVLTNMNEILSSGENLQLTTNFQNEQILQAAFDHIGTVLTP